MSQQRTSSARNARSLRARSNARSKGTAWQPHAGRWHRLPQPPPPVASRHGEIWSEADERLLAQYYTTHGGFYTAAVLGRSVLATRNRAGKLGIPGYETCQWKRQEIRWAYRELMRAPFGSEPIKAIARELGRTPASVIGKLLRPQEGLPRLWSARETAWLQENYRKMTLTELARELNRAEDAVMVYACRRGMKKWYTARRPWSRQEDAWLRRMYRNNSIVEIARVMGRPQRDVADRLAKLGIERVSHRTWKPQERRFLEEQYGRMSCGAIAARLGRTISAVHMQANLMDLRRRQSRKLWTAREDAMLREQYRAGEVERLAARMGRPAGSLHNRARRLGIIKTSARPWTNEERRLVKKLYKTHTLAAMGEKLGRTCRSVESRVRAMGLVEKEGKYRRWTAGEDQQLQKLYGKIPDEELAAQLRRTPGAVRARARGLGLQ